MIDPPPYATWERRVDGGSAVWRWRYAPIDQFAASHFASARFLEAHSLQVLGRSGNATVLGFCPRGAEKTGIEGELQVSDAGEFREARWRFRVDHDDEDAGGEVTFASAKFEDGVYLFALRGSSWRRAREGLYNQDRFALTEWRFGRSISDVELPPSR